MFDALSKSAICSSRIVITRSPGRTRVRLERATGNVRLATVTPRLYRCARWTLLIIRDAFYGVRRFNDFQAHLDIPKPYSPPGSSHSSTTGSFVAAPIQTTPAATSTS